MTEQNEPSMEDILASIRNILAEDEEGNKEQNVQSDPVQKQKPVSLIQPEQKSASAQSDPEPLPEKVSLDTPETINDDHIVNLTADMIVPSDENKEQSDPVFVEDEEDDFTPEPVIPQEPMKEETLNDLIKETAERHFENDDSLLAEPTVAAAAESLAHLRDIASEKKLHLGKGDMTIEAIVRETLKPYLKEWLDVNLPDIVERVVKKEIAHVMDRLDLK